ncbi:MAG: metalloregulator ArsR/SmtB family transcription factor [Anaerolineales bacterium]|jgi:DNA-binding transcriptional ArsR family regulator
MMNTKLKAYAAQQADFYRVFSSPTRLRILWALVDQELSVGEIASAAETSLQNTSQHLHLMQDKGILTSRRESQTIYYRIADNETVKRYILELQEFCLDLQAKRRQI